MSAAAALILSLARARGATLSTAESCTGGMLAAALTDLSGSSAIFDSGTVTYSNAAKMRLLGVKEATLDAHGAVSEEVAREMALGARAAAGATLALSITGIAGPGGSDFKPEGRVCFALADAAGSVSETVEFGALGRAKVRRAAVEHALDLILRHLKA